MTVRELIEVLGKADPEAEVHLGICIVDGNSWESDSYQAKASNASLAGDGVTVWGEIVHDGYEPIEDG